jgi:hypothetical protein
LVVPGDVPRTFAAKPFVLPFAAGRSPRSPAPAPATNEAGEAQIPESATVDSEAAPAVESVVEASEGESSEGDAARDQSPRDSEPVDDQPVNDQPADDYAGDPEPVPERETASEPDSVSLEEPAAEEPALGRNDMTRNEGAGDSTVPLEDQAATPDAEANGSSGTASNP